MNCLDEKWMRIALQEAELAAKEGEIPVGAVVVRNGELISRAHNLCEQDANATSHAEVLAIAEACQKIGSWRLSDCTLYVTLEPCMMCTGASVNARLGRIVYAAKDPRAGACESLIKISSYPLECKPILCGGVLEEESLALLRNFFLNLRKKEQ